jgi:hypothetical protein
MGSLRFRKSVRIAPGLRFNIGKKSVGVSAGVRGARYSINSSGRRTRSVGIPGSGLSYRAQSGASPGAANVAPKGSPNSAIASPTRLTASLVGWLTVLVFVLGIISGAPQLAGTIAGIGVAVYIVLRVARGILDPLIIWLPKRRSR